MNRNTKIVLIAGGALVVVYLLFRSQLSGLFSSVQSLIQPVNPAPQPFGGPPIAMNNYRPGPPAPSIPSSVGSVLKQIQTGSYAAADIANNVGSTISDIEDLFGGN